MQVPTAYCSVTEASGRVRRAPFATARVACHKELQAAISAGVRAGRDLVWDDKDP